MTEEEWLVCDDPTSMVFDVQFDHNSLFVKRERKLRLLACACCRLMWHSLVYPRSRAAVAVGERYADGLASLEETREARHKAYNELPHPIRVFDVQQLSQAERVQRSATAAARSVCFAEDGRNFVDHVQRVIMDTLQVAWDEASGLGGEETTGTLISLIRDIVGPLRFRLIVADPAWLTSTAVAIAQGMYELRDFSAMPILADSLQDAGCDNADILWHCRDESQVHVRGCWVVDLVLGKE